jgi:hypothetical protein
MRGRFSRYFSLAVGTVLMLSSSIVFGSPPHRPVPVHAPEIGAAALAPALCVLLGGLVILTGKRKKRPVD